jgi:hypothetical protein
MKTTKLMLALSFALIIVSGYSSMSAPKFPASGIPVENKAKWVTYVVKIENESNLNAAAQYLVMMTDESGHQVATAQLYHPGISDYTFKEAGTVRGTRVARLVKLPGKLNSMGIQPSSQTGVFYSGGTYMFIIRVMSAEIEGGGLRN